MCVRTYEYDWRRGSARKLVTRGRQNGFVIRHRKHTHVMYNTPEFRKQRRK